MKKQEFKKLYSEYRKALSKSYYSGREAFINQFNSNDLFRSIRVSLQDKPVSIPVWLYLNKQN